MAKDVIMRMIGQKKEKVKPSCAVMLGDFRTVICQKTNSFNGNR
jgi:hypothetical protein